LSFSPDADIRELKEVPLEKPEARLGASLTRFCALRAPADIYTRKKVDRITADVRIVVGF
jgi:hypothetical protein